MNYLLYDLAEYMYDLTPQALLPLTKKKQEPKNTGKINKKNLYRSSENTVIIIDSRCQHWHSRAGDPRADSEYN